MRFTLAISTMMGVAEAKICPSLDDKKLSDWVDTSREIRRVVEMVDE